MMAHGPGTPFDLFMDLDQSVGDGDQARGLPADIRAVYRGDWVLPEASDGIYCYSNFVMSHDGRVSFNVPGHEGGGDVSGFNAHDQWLMGLLRARADAVMVGANTLRTESEHVWTSAFIFPADEPSFASLRQAEGRRATPLQVFVTRSGDVSAEAAVFHQSDLECVVVTTQSGASRVKSLDLPHTTVVVAGATDVDFPTALARLASDFGVQTLLCEGGPRVYGAVIEAGVLDEEFLTLSPVLVGADQGQPRPGLVEGFALAPGNPLRAELVSVRRAGDHLFLRTSLRSRLDG